MTLKEWLSIKIAEVFGVDLAGFLITLVGAFVLGVTNHFDAMLVFLAVSLFFLGFFVARQIYTPNEEKPQFGLKAMTPDELEEMLRRQ